LKGLKSLNIWETLTNEEIKSRLHCEIIRYRIFCLPLCCRKIKNLRHTYTYLLHGAESCLRS
jgi:hypothetical protein